MQTQSITAVADYCHSHNRIEPCTTCLYLARSKERWLVFLKELDTVNKRIDERAKLKEVRQA